MTTASKLELGGWVLGVLAFALLAGCGEPVVTYEVRLPEELAAHGGLFKSCIARCDAARRGVGCKDGGGALTLGANPCDGACALLVALALDDDCLIEQGRRWDCEAALQYSCVGAAATPTATSASACQGAVQSHLQCIAEGGSTLNGAPGLTVATACASLCRADEKLCEHEDTACVDTCTAQAVSGLPQECTKTAAVHMKCNAKSAACANGQLEFEGCKAEAAALKACKAKHTPVPAPQRACLDACLAIGKNNGCADFAANACVDGCADYADLPSICTAVGAAYWACAVKPTNLDCATQADPVVGCASEKAAVASCKTPCATGDCICVPGTVACDGDNAVKCAPDGKSWPIAQLCAGFGAQCAAGKCIGGKPCAKPGALECVGEKLMKCEADGALVLQEDCAATKGKVCSAPKCVTSCEPGSFVCEGAALKQCAVDGKALAPMYDCTGNLGACTELACVNGKSVCGEKSKPDGTMCNDDDYCTDASKCESGKCEGIASTFACDDKMACTLDSCPLGLGCKFLANHAACNDGNACTVDACVPSKGCKNILQVFGCTGTVIGGACYHVQGNKFDGMDGEGTCAWYGGHLASFHNAQDWKAAKDWLAKEGYVSPTMIGLFRNGPVWVWTDGTPHDFVNWASGEPNQKLKFAFASGTKDGWSTDQYQGNNFLCKIPLAPTCDDGVACTVGDACKDGACAAGKPKCDDGNPCTVDLCDAASATVCSYKGLASGAACDDGLKCTVGDGCDGKGSCVPGGPNTCDDGNPCTTDSCTEAAGCANTAGTLPTSCGTGLACVGASCKPEGVCGDGTLNVAGEQCDDKNTVPQDGCAPNCKIEPMVSCKALKAAYPYLPDGGYPIDPDGAGPLQPLNLHCSLKSGAWTVVANIYDSAGDDIPNLAQDVTAGWQQTGSGTWKPVSTVAVGGQSAGSSAVGMEFVAAIAKSGVSAIQLCLLDGIGSDGPCQPVQFWLWQANGPLGNPLLDPYVKAPAAWAYGRLIGLAATAATLDPSMLKTSAGCVPMDQGSTYEFGGGCPKGWSTGLCETPPLDGWGGTWCAYCTGMCMRPAAQNDEELGVGALKTTPALANPTFGWGIRIYVDY